MKKVLFLAAFLPAALLAQNITNTLGASGAYVVEDNGTLDAVYINPGTEIFIFGKQPATLNIANLPAGNYKFIRDNGAAQVSIIAGKNAGIGVVPRLDFFYTTGSLVSPLPAIMGDVLGVVGFGGRTAANPNTWISDVAGIKVEVRATSTLVNPFIATKMTFSTSNHFGNLRRMELDSNGTLVVDGAISSKAIKSVSTNYSAKASDQTIICSTDITVTLPSVANVPVGKTYTVKKGYTANNTTTINTTGGQFIDGGTATSASLTGNNVFGYITIQSDGTRWWIIAQGNGI